MFGALNRFIARLDGEPSSRPAEQGPSDNSYGFQVLKNPNKELPLEPWFDFIIGINGHFIASSDIFREVNKHANFCARTLPIRTYSRQKSATAQADTAL